MQSGERVEDVPGHNFERWTLEQALAWVLYRDMRWVEKMRRGSLKPTLPAPFAEHFSADPVDSAWRDLHKLLWSDIPLTSEAGEPVRIPVFGIRDGGDGKEAVIPPEVMARLDWRLSDDTDDIYLCTRRGLLYLNDGAVFYRGVSVPRRAVEYNFPSTGRRRLGGILETYGAPALPASGYIWLTRAAYWIASKGGAFDFLPDDAEIWRPALEELRNEITDERVTMIGRSYKSGGLTERLEGIRAAGIEIIPPCWPQELDDIFNTRPRITCGGLHHTDDDWYRGGGDKIWGHGSAIEYTHLQVKADDVRKLWPFEETLPPSVVDQVNVTAAPPLPKVGAPSGPRFDDTPLFEEMAAMLASGECRSVSRAAEAVVGKAEGGGTDASRIKRLRSGYSEWAKGRTEEMQPADNSAAN